MVDGSSLENWRTRKGIGGSNPSSSATPISPRSASGVRIPSSYLPSLRVRGSNPSSSATTYLPSLASGVRIPPLPPSRSLPPSRTALPLLRGPAFASEIGPGFSPDIPGPAQCGLKPLRPALLPPPSRYPQPTTFKGPHAPSCRASHPERPTLVAQEALMAGPELLTDIDTIDDLEFERRTLAAIRQELGLGRPRPLPRHLPLRSRETTPPNVTCGSTTLTLEDIQRRTPSQGAQTHPLQVHGPISRVRENSQARTYWRGWDARLNPLPRGWYRNGQ